MPESPEIPRWPEGLPVPLIDGYGVKPEDRRGRSEFDIGSRFRLQFDTDETAASCALILDAEQSNQFEAFERDVLVQGSRWFLMPLWVAGQMLDHLVRFKTRPEMGAKIGFEWAQYSFELDVARREGLMDEDWAKFLLEADPYLFMKLEDRLQIIVNVKFPKALPFGKKYW